VAGEHQLKLRSAPGVPSESGFSDTFLVEMAG